MITIRPGRDEDVPDLVRMTGAFLEGSVYGQLIPFKPEIATVLAERLIAEGVVFVAETGNGLVGMICGAAFEELVGGVRMLDELAWWVDPNHRRSSVGPKLLRAWEDWARQHGVGALRMVAPLEAKGVVEYYITHGYRPLDTAFLKRL